MKIVIVVPDGVGVRNYIYSSFIQNLLDYGFRIYIFHKLSENALDTVKKSNSLLQDFLEIPNFVEAPKARFYREMLAYARLQRNKKFCENPTIQKFWSPSKKGIKKKLLYFFAETIGTIYSKNYKLILKGDQYFEKEISKDRTTHFFKKELNKIQPDFILNLHQRSPLASPIVIAAKQLQIKTSTVIFSWDNVPKARLVAKYNYYFVWSELMKTEILSLYPEILANQVSVTGTPQFEFYFDKSLYKNKKDFFKEFDLDLNKKTICFTGNDLLSPYDALYLEDVCEQIEKIPVKERPQILFRRCPVDLSSRFDKVLEKYTHIVFPIDPDWKIDKENGQSFVSIYPSINDNVLLANTVKHSDLVINLGSTVAHDFAVLDKPCLYLNYDPVKNSTFKVEDVYQFQHFKSMNDLEAVGWLNSKQEIANRVLETLRTPKKTGKDRKKWMQNIVRHPLEDNAKNLATTIKNLVNS